MSSSLRVDHIHARGLLGREREVRPLGKLREYVRLLGSLGAFCIESMRCSLKIGRIY